MGKSIGRDGASLAKKIASAVATTLPERTRDVAQVVPLRAYAEKGRRDQRYGRKAHRRGWAAMSG